ncbi:MAG TPA: hypothetical protein VMV44_08745, partial [Rectinemataceae bacterium]|nr:hypothetical protein [Rectinemataceae bacterium]
MILLLLLSGCTGALLGYLAWRLASLLLFYPNRPISFFGHRLPLTPGLWLRHRASLAGLVADVFAKEFATGEVLREGLRDAKSLPKLEAGISSRLSLVLERPLGLLLSAPEPAVGTGEARGGVEGQVPFLALGKDGAKAAGLAGDMARRLLSNPGLAGAFDRALGEALGLVKDLPISVLLPPDQARSLAASFLSEESLRRLADRLDLWVQGRGRAGAAAMSGPGGLPAIQTEPPEIEA